MPSYHDIVQRELQSAKQRYRDVGLDAPVIERTINGRKHEMLTYAAPGSIVAGGIDALSLNFASMTPETMPVVTWATTNERVIRSNERMEVAGVQLKHYLANPVILWSHDASLPPIGKGMNPRPSVVKGEKVMLLDIRFNCVGQLAQDICKLVMLGDIAAGSHGFIPLATKIEPTQNYPDAYPHFPNVCTYTKWEMLEFSPCTIPLNPGALRQHSIDSEFEARLRDRIQAGLIEHDGEGIVRALGGMQINAGQYPSNAVSELLTPGVVDGHKIASNGISMDRLESHPQPDQTMTVQQHEYHSVWEAGAVYAPIPELITSDIERFTATISADDLTADGLDQTLAFHLLNGVTTKNPDVVIAALAGAQEFEVTFGEIAIETGDEWRDYDRMFADIVAPGGADVSKQLNDQLYGWSRDLRIHLADLKTGRGAAYAGSDQLSGKSFMVTELVFRDVTGTETTIPLAKTTKTHTDRVRNITMPPITTHELPPNAMPDPSAPPAPAPEPEAPEKTDLKSLKGLDFDLAYLAKVKEHVKEWMDMSALAESNSNSAAVKDLAGSVTTAAQTVLDAVNKILTDLGVDMSSEQPAEGETPAEGTVQASWFKAMSFVNARKHVGSAFNATHKGYIKAMYEPCALLHAAAFGTETPKTGTASLSPEVAEIVRIHKADMERVMGEIAVLKATLNPAPVPVELEEVTPEIAVEIETVDLSDILTPIP